MKKNKERHSKTENVCDILLMAEILHQLIWQTSQYLTAFIHPRWCRISSINSSKTGHLRGGKVISFPTAMFFFWGGGWHVTLMGVPNFRGKPKFWLIFWARHQQDDTTKMVFKKMMIHMWQKKAVMFTENHLKNPNLAWRSIYSRGKNVSMQTTLLAPQHSNHYHTHIYSNQLHGKIKI